jgi:hypothetical protein
MFRSVFLRILVATVLLSVALSACNVGGGAAVPPTLDPGVVASAVAAAQTQAVATISAQATETALAAPSPTNTVPPEPTATATVTPTTFVLATSTPTRVVFPTLAVTATKAAPTITPTPSAFACSVTAMTPANNAKFKPNEPFDLNVTFKNIGTQNWDAGDVDFHYVEGTKFQDKVDVLDLPATTKPGETVKFIVDMTAPNTVGSFNAVWALTGGGKANFCKITITIRVEQ